MPALVRALDPSLSPRYRELSWQRTIPLATHLATHSFLARLGPDAARPVLAEEEETIGALFPDGLVTEPFALRLTVVPLPAAAAAKMGG